MSTTDQKTDAVEVSPSAPLTAEVKKARKPRALPKVVSATGEERKAARAKKVKKTTKAPKKAAAAKTPKVKAKSKKAGTVVVVKRSKDFQRIKRIGDKEHKVDLTRYDTVISAGGNSSLDNGDEVAQLLRGKTLDEAYKITAKHVEETEEQLRHNYGHLNIGMQRMNLGNKLRAILKAGDDEE